MKLNNITLFVSGSFLNKEILEEIENDLNLGTLTITIDKEKSFELQVSTFSPTITDSGIEYHIYSDDEEEMELLNSYNFDEVEVSAGLWLEEIIDYDLTFDLTTTNNSYRINIY